MLEIDRIDSYYGDSQVLFDVSLSVDDGDVVSIVGRNGVGKTTTLRSIMNLVTVNSGTISYRDEEITGLKTENIAKRGIGYVPENRQIFGGLTVEENLRIAAANIGDTKAGIQLALEYFPLLEDLLESRGSHLSGGEQQMLAIARAFIADNDLLLIDEPNEGLAPTIAEDVKESLMELKGEVTVLLVGQSVSLVTEISDYLYGLEDGKVVFEATPEEAQKNNLIEDVMTV